MARKNLATTITTILCALTFIVIGSCFSAFIYKKEVIKVENPKLILSQGIQVFNVDEEKQIEELELSKMKLGLKPATGDEDANTNIPSTITDKQGSEGQYAKFKLFAPSGARIFITDILIENPKETIETIREERKNIMVAIKELEGEAKSLSADKVELGTVEAGDDKKEWTFMIWLSSKVGEKLESSTISFKLSFESVD